MVDSITSRTPARRRSRSRVVGPRTRSGVRIVTSCQSERLGVLLASPQALVSDQGAAGMRSRQLAHGLVLLLVGATSAYPSGKPFGSVTSTKRIPHRN